MNQLTPYTSITHPTSSSEQHRSKREGCKYPFPERLFDLLQDIVAKKTELSCIISLHPNGEAFLTHNHEKFKKEIQRKYFNQFKYASFRRQLNLWGFGHIKTPDDHDTNTEQDSSSSLCYFHPLFQRHDRRLCCTMARVGRDGSRRRSVSLSTTTINSECLKSLHQEC